MKTYYGNYLGIVISGGEKDPEGRGRCQVFIPHIMPTLYEGWNKEGTDISFNIIGDGLPTGLNPDIVATLKKILPWAECAAPIMGASPSVKDGSEMTRNVALRAGSFGVSPGAFEGAPSAAGSAYITNTPWSAGFISYVAGVNSSTFPGAGMHTTYATAVRNNQAPGWQAFNPANTQVQPGDIVIKNRGGNNLSWNSTWTGVSHGDVVTGVSGNTITTVGGNVGNSVSQTNVASTNGIINSSNYFAILRPPASTANNIAATAQQEYLTWSSNNWNEQSAGALGTLSKYYAAGNLQVPPGVNHSAINLDVGQNMKPDGTTAGADYSLKEGTLPESIKSKITPESSAALQRVAGQYGLDPNAIALLVNTESGWRTSTTSPGGTYRGATQIGEATFREAGGTLGGLSWNQFLNASIDRQIDVYGAWLNHYDFSRKISDAGINLSGLTTAQQAALLQGFQFSPNGTSWLNAFGSGDGSVRSTTTDQADRLGSTSMNDMTKYYTELYGGSLAQTVANQNIIKNPTQHASAYGPDTNYQSLGMFGYASEGTTVWVFFREGNPLFPVYFAASYGQREWQGMYQYSSPGIGGGEGGALPNTERARFNSYGGGFDSVQVTENPELGLEGGFAFQVYGKNGSNLLFAMDHTEFNSVYNHNQKVSGDFHEITEANKEQRVRGDSNTYVEQDVYITVGNWSSEAQAASDEIQSYLNEAMKIKSSAGSSSSSSGSSTYKPTSPLGGIQQSLTNAANKFTETAQKYLPTSKRT